MTSSRSTSAREAAERDAPDARQLVDQLGDGVGDADPDRGDVEQVDPRHRLRRQRRDRRVAQAQRGDAGEQVGREVGEALVGADRRATRGRRRRRARRTRRDTSLNVLHSSRRARSRSRSSHRASSSSRSTSVRPGQQAAGLQLDEGRGDEQELGGHVEVERLHPLDLDQVGVDDAGQATS